MGSRGIVIVLVVNAIICSAFVLPKLSHQGALKRTEHLMTNQDGIDERDPSLPPSPVPVQSRHHNNRRHPPNTPDEPAISRIVDQQANEINHNPKQNDQAIAIRETRIKIFKASILKALDLQQPPNITDSGRVLPNEILERVSEPSIRSHHHGVHHQPYVQDDKTTTVYVSANIQGRYRCVV